MRKTVNRSIEINCCDFCGEENKNVTQCGRCKKEMCTPNKHAAYALEIYRYKDSERLITHICNECNKHGAICQEIDKMIDNR